MKMLHVLAIGLVLASLMVPRIAAAQQSYSVQFYAFYIAGPNHDHTATITVDGTNVASDSFAGSGVLTATVTLDASSHHTITASLDDQPPANAADADCWSGWDSGSWCTNPNTADHADMYGGSLYVNGNRCSQSDAVSSINSLSCSFGAGQPVPNLSNGFLTMPMVLILLTAALLVLKRANGKNSRN